jgi:hypothetical protein
MNNIFKNIVEAQLIVAKMKPTYCGEICFKMRKGVEDFVETIESYYTAHGTEAIVRDKRDGQEYVIQVTPRKK